MFRRHWKWEGKNRPNNPIELGSQEAKQHAQPYFQSDQNCVRWTEGIGHALEMGLGNDVWIQQTIILFFKPHYPHRPLARAQLRPPFWRRGGLRFSQRENCPIRGS